jgi:hypothetical protein
LGAGVRLSASSSLSWLRPRPGTDDDTRRTPPSAAPDSFVAALTMRPHRPSDRGRHLGLSPPRLPGSRDGRAAPDVGVLFSRDCARLDRGISGADRAEPHRRRPACRTPASRAGDADPVQGLNPTCWTASRSREISAARRTGGGDGQWRWAPVERRVGSGIRRPSSRAASNHRTHRRPLHPSSPGSSGGARSDGRGQSTAGT